MDKTPTRAVLALLLRGAVGRWRPDNPSSPTWAFPKRNLFAYTSYQKNSRYTPNKNALVLPRLQDFCPKPSSDTALEVPHREREMPSSLTGMLIGFSTSYSSQENKSQSLVCNKNAMKISCGEASANGSASVPSDPAKIVSSRVLSQNRR